MVLAPDRVQRHVLVAHFNGLVLRPGNISSLVKHRIPVCGILVRVPAQELISLTRRIVLVDLHSDRASDVADIVGLRRRAVVAVKVQRNLHSPLSRQRKITFHRDLFARLIDSAVLVVGQPAGEDIDTIIRGFRRGQHRSDVHCLVVDAPLGSIEVIVQRGNLLPYSEQRQIANAVIAVSDLIFDLAVLRRRPSQKSVMLLLIVDDLRRLVRALAVREVHQTSADRFAV